MNAESTDLSTIVEQVPVGHHQASLQPSINVHSCKARIKRYSGLLPVDRKFNIILFGIKENAPETSRPD